MVELLVLMGALAIIALVLLPMMAGSHGCKAPRMKCTNNLKNVGLAARIFATDNNDLLPGAYYFLSNKIDLTKLDSARYFRTLSNELSTPKILYCPEDKRRKEASSFTNLTSKNISYFISLTACETNPECILGGDRNMMVNRKDVPAGVFTLTTNLQAGWSKEIHNEQGNLLMADGSVQQTTSARLKLMIVEQGVSTNLLLFP